MRAPSRPPARCQPVLLTECLLRTANRAVPPRLSQIVLLDVVRLRLRRPIHAKPSGYWRFAALVTKPGEISGLTASLFPLLGGRTVDEVVRIEAVVGGERSTICDKRGGTPRFAVRSRRPVRYAG